MYYCTMRFYLFFFTSLSFTILLPPLSFFAPFIHLHPSLTRFNSQHFHARLHSFAPTACVPISHQCLRNRCWQGAGILSGQLCNAVCLPCAQEDTGGQCKSITSSLSSLIGLRTGVEVCSGADGLARPICLQCKSRCEAQTLSSHTTYFVSLPLKQTILPQFLLADSWLDKFNGR